jgi:hypothetical protein
LCDANLNGKATTNFDKIPAISNFDKILSAFCEILHAKNRTNRRSENRGVVFVTKGPKIVAESRYPSYITYLLHGAESFLRS